MAGIGAGKLLHFGSIVLWEQDNALWGKCVPRDREGVWHRYNALADVLQAVGLALQQWHSCLDSETSLLKVSEVHGAVVHDDVLRSDRSVGHDSLGV